MYEKKHNHKTGACRDIDVAILFLRLFTGGIVLLHNIGKLQDYNEIIDSYPALLFNSPQVTFAVFSILECLFAVMIIMGIKMRFAAFIMSLGMFLSIFTALATKNMTASVLQFVYMGIYIFFVLSGSGRYAFDRGWRTERKRRIYAARRAEHRSLERDNEVK